MKRKTTSCCGRQQWTGTRNRDSGTDPDRTRCKRRAGRTHEPYPPRGARGTRAGCTTHFPTPSASPSSTSSKTSRSASASSTGSRGSPARAPYHLTGLKEAGLVKGEYSGNWIIYSITGRGSGCSSAPNTQERKNKAVAKISRSHFLVVACLALLLICSFRRVPLFPRIHYLLRHNRFRQWHGRKNRGYPLPRGPAGELHASRSGISRSRPLRNISPVKSRREKYPSGISTSTIANKEIVASHGVTGSSLAITSYDANGVHPSQDMGMSGT